MVSGVYLNRYFVVAAGGWIAPLFLGRYGNSEDVLCSSLDHQRMEQSQHKSKNKSSKEWTWKQQTDVIKWQGTPIDGPLLRLEDPELTPLAIECFDCILRYCGDLPLTPEMSEVKCVYTVLMVR